MIHRSQLKDAVILQQAWQVGPFADMLRLCYARLAAYAWAHNMEYIAWVGCLKPDLWPGGWGKSAANRCVLVEPAWTANLNVQAGQRILAPGKHAVVQFATLANTLDEAMVARHLREVRMAQEVYATRRADTRTIAR